jgi:hypothetical protein
MVVRAEARSGAEASEIPKKDIAPSRRSGAEASEIQKRDIATAHASTVDRRSEANDC